MQSPYQKLIDVTSDGLRSVIAAAESRSGPLPIWKGDAIGWVIFEKSPSSTASVTVYLKPADGHMPESNTPQKFILEVTVQASSEGEDERSFWSSSKILTVEESFSDEEVNTWITDTVTNAF